MIIKVCGLREPDNIRAVSALDINMTGFIFWEGSARSVKHAPRTGRRMGRVGVFVDATPQAIVSRAHSDALDYIQLHGSESAAYIEQLKCALASGGVQNVKMIKALSIREADDVKRWRDYEGTADMLLFDNKCTARGGSGEKFDWAALDSYDGNIPFLLSGGIGPDDADSVLTIRHPQFAGVDLNSRFEIRPAVKDTEKLKCFINKIRTYEQNQ